MKKIIKNKKGGMSDLFIFMIIAFAMAIGVVILYFAVTSGYNSLMGKLPLFDKVLAGTGENATDVINSTVGQVLISYESLKWITVMLFIGMAMAVLMSGYLITVKSPVYFVPYTLIVIIAIVVSAVLSNVYETIYQNSVLASAFSGFWGQTWIFLNLPIWIAVIGFGAGIVMYIQMVRMQDIGGGI